MNEKEAWNVFMLTGSVQDYLHYKSLQEHSNKNKPTTTQTNEISNHRTDNPTTEYR